MDEERIRNRAYAIWEREGCPEGRHEAHWEQARQELLDEERRGRERAEREAPATPGADALGPDERLHPSGRNGGGTLRPAAEAIGGLEGRSRARGGNRTPGGGGTSGGA